MKRRPTHPLPGRPRDRVAAIPVRHYQQPAPGGTVEYAEPPTCGALPEPRYMPDHGRVYGCNLPPAHGGDFHRADAVTHDGRQVPSGWVWPRR